MKYWLEIKTYQVNAVIFLNKYFKYDGYINIGSYNINWDGMEFEDEKELDEYIDEKINYILNENSLDYEDINKKFDKNNIDDMKLSLHIAMQRCIK